MVALVETYQQKDGSILIPDVLRKYIGVDKIEKK
jgi:seryl-tRNA synthetase